MELEHFFKENGIVALIAVFSLRVVMETIKFGWSLVKKKSEITDKSIDRLEHSIDELKAEITCLNAEIVALNKIKVDLRRNFEVLRTLAGTKWDEIMKAILDKEKGV